MPTLSSSIVKHHVASVRDVEEALARQAIYGGDLVTNLLELSTESEPRLAALLAESFGAAPAPTGELPSAGPEVLRLVPQELAGRFGLYPLQLGGDTLVVAVSEPLPVEVESDLRFSLGVGIEQRIALGVRIRQALARDYGLALEQRSQRILAKLSGLPDPHPTIVPGPHPAPDAEPAAELSVPGPSEPAAPLDRAPLPADPAKSRAREAVDLTTLTRKAPKPRRIGPYTPAMAEQDLLTAADSEDVLCAFFDFAAQYFEYTALFAVQGDLAEGRDAAGSGAPRARVLSLGIPLDLPSSLARVTASGTFSLVRLGTGGLDGAFARDLERRPGPQVLLLPVRVRKRPVLVLYGDHGRQDVQLDAVGEVISFAPLVQSALERLILKRKNALSRSIAPPAPRVKSLSLPRAEERAAALASALSTEAAPPPPPTEPEVALVRPVIAIGGRPLTPSQHPLPEAAAPAEDERPHVRLDDEPVQAAFGREHGTRPGVGSRKLELVEDEPAAAPSTSQRATPSPEAPELLLGEGTIEDELDEPPSDGGVPLAAASRSLAHSARPLPVAKSSEELRLPTVIVDLANDCEALLSDLLAGSAAAGDKLVQLGEPAITVLVSAFPGPITAELRRGIGSAPSRASECGPVLRTLARIGPRAAPVLVVRTADADATVRAWATRLLGEMPSEEAARAIVRRFIDDEQEVRRAALAAGRLMQSNAEASAMIQAGLAQLLTDAGRPEHQRHALIEAVADLRDGRAFPTVLRLLEDPSSDIVRSAHWALVVLARQDFGLSAAAWAEWWRMSSTRHRIEWLIDALSHDSADVRRAAGDELKSTTKEYFGYYDDLPIAERQKAQSRYREWWETKGKARFH
jgi:Type II secretion system (T2SS), protein E, N-terminal domain